MKLSRNQLKGIVKECLMEILAEGLLHESPAVPKKKKRKQQLATNIPTLVEASEPEEDKFAAAVENAVSGLTNDPIMSSIFKDTAMTTLQEQINGEKHRQVVPQNFGAQAQSDDLDNLFGEAADRWASLAFTEKKTMP